jgi:hypothetical protein
VRDQVKCTICEELGPEVSAPVPVRRFESDVTSVVGLEVEVEEELGAVLLEQGKGRIFQFM